MNTCFVLEQATRCLEQPETSVYMDSGVENINKDVDDLLERGSLEQVVAQSDVTVSKAIIENLWRSLKHGWSFMNHPGSLVTLRKLIEFHVIEHNETTMSDDVAAQCTGEVCQAVFVVAHGASSALEWSFATAGLESRLIVEATPVRVGETRRRELTDSRWLEVNDLLNGLPELNHLDLAADGSSLWRHVGHKVDRSVDPDSCPNGSFRTGPHRVFGSCRLVSGSRSLVAHVRVHARQSEGWSDVIFQARG